MGATNGPREVAMGAASGAARAQPQVLWQGYGGTLAQAWTAAVGGPLRPHVSLLWWAQAWGRSWGCQRGASLLKEGHCCNKSSDLHREGSA